jgi:hypothetical protein
MDGFLAAVVVLFMTLVIGVTAFLVENQNRIDRINNNFTRHCNSLGGHAIITDKDLCVRRGLIIDHEG